jgi:hypothetical protein
MSRILKAYDSGRFLILVSPPANDPNLFEAAFECGVDGAKVHLNVEHRASGRHFGSWSQEKVGIHQILTQAPVPLGVMPGAEALPTRDEMVEMAEVGIDFFDIYAQHMPGWMQGVPMTPMLALGHGTGPDDLAALEARGMEVLEASVVDPACYGQALDEADLEAYRALAAASSCPLLVPSQKALVPGDLPRLQAVGVQSVLLGVLSLGDNPESFSQALPEFLKVAADLG